MLLLATMAFGQAKEDAGDGEAEHPWGWEVDHIKPISEGGTNKLSNLRPLNIPANRGRNN